MNKLIIFVLAIFYESLTSIYLWLPPLFGIAFILFMRAFEEQDYPALSLIVLYMIYLEVDKEIILFSSIIFFMLAHKFIVPKLRAYFQCKRCLEFIYIVLAYFGFFGISMILHKILWIEMFSFDWIVIYYILIEFMIVFLGM
jgi:hypothetical protein